MCWNHFMDVLKCWTQISRWLDNLCIARGCTFVLWSDLDSGTELAGFKGNVHPKIKIQPLSTQPLCRWIVRWNLIIPKTFLVLHSKTVLQRSPKQLKQVGTLKRVKTKQNVIFGWAAPLIWTVSQSFVLSAVHIHPDPSGGAHSRCRPQQACLDVGGWNGSQRPGSLYWEWGCLDPRARHPRWGSARHGPCPVSTENLLILR